MLLSPSTRNWMVSACNNTYTRHPQGQIWRGGCSGLATPPVHAEKLLTDMRSFSQFSLFKLRSPPLPVLEGRRLQRVPDSAPWNTTHRKGDWSWSLQPLRHLQMNDTWYDKQHFVTQIGSDSQNILRLPSLGANTCQDPVANNPPKGKCLTQLWNKRECRQKRNHHQTQFRHMTSGLLPRHYFWHYLVHNHQNRYCFNRKTGTLTCQPKTRVKGVSMRPEVDYLDSSEYPKFQLCVKTWQFCWGVGENTRQVNPSISMNLWTGPCQIEITQIAFRIGSARWQQTHKWPEAHWSRSTDNERGGGGGNLLTIFWVVDVVVQFAVASHLEQEHDGCEDGHGGNRSKRVSNLPLNLILQRRTTQIRISVRIFAENFSHNPTTISEI